ncbi:DUF4157 domain-containing protein [Azotobacter chroococcum]|uniref:DUF4157 domain-containing protein n=1 Tax=Azotobacter chroococcum TaxID=353 RepID=A0AA44C8H4_9GAMM|nr:DUF4157 domain-containing protein [Azotobacter chroococcum]NHN79641.1 DUF4157 domain-containing protein [Azotobacter chroococcum]
MSTAALQRSQPAKSQPTSNASHASLLLQRKCACGKSTTSLTGECAECASKTRLQTKLTVGASNDPLELEADRVADQVMAAPTSSPVRGVPLRIQRYTTQPSEADGVAPASVDRVLASPGRPLEPALRQDMESRFGYDFSRVLVHTGGAAEQSARDVSANAYTVGNDIVFGARRFSPGTHEERRLIAHELAHVLQHSDAGGTFGTGKEGHASPLERRGRAKQLQRQAGAADSEAVGTPAVDSISGALTLDGFASDSAELTPAHNAAVAGYKTLIAKLLKQYPDSFISVVGHTDATESEDHNQVLGLQRAEAVVAALGSGESTIPASIMSAANLGKTQLKIPTQGREAHNRRVEVYFSARKFGYRKVPEFRSTPDLGKSHYKLPERPPIYPSGSPPGPNYLTQSPPPSEQAEGNSILDMLNKEIVDPVVKRMTSWLPKSVQERILGLAHEAVEIGVSAWLEEALKDARLSEKQQEDIKEAVKQAIELKNKPFDRQGEREGSPWYKQPESSHAPEELGDSLWKLKWTW